MTTAAVADGRPGADVWPPPLPAILRAPTPPAWLAVARREPAALLVDHAHCERKAAGQAMALVAAYPAHDWLVAPMLALAQEELRHLAQVLAELRRLGVAWRADRGDPYAAALHRKVRGAGDPDGRLLDRLLVAALIEARSCERLGLLAEAFGRGRRLGDFYARLARAEAGHHELFVRLAGRAAGGSATVARLDSLAAAEVNINAVACSAPRVH